MLDFGIFKQECYLYNQQTLYDKNCSIRYTEIREIIFPIHFFRVQFLAQICSFDNNNIKK